MNNRFQGRDFILPGTHVAGGVSGITNHSVFGDITGFAGLSYKVQGETPDGLTISGREDFSDYIASLSVNTPFNLNLSWSGRADYDELKLNESRTSLDYGTGRTSVNLEHTQIAQGFFEAVEDDKEEAQIKLTHKLPNDIRLIAEQVSIILRRKKRDQSVLGRMEWWCSKLCNAITRL